MESNANQIQVERSSKHRKRRSPVTNRTRLHEDLYEVNGNAVLARRFRDLVDSLLAELGVTDADERQFTSIRTAAMATCRMEALEADHCAGRPVSDPVYTRLVGVLRQARADLGLDDDQTKSDRPPPVPGGGGVAETLAAAGKSMPNPTKVGE